MVKQKNTVQQKIKLLILWEILYLNSDENNPLSTCEIVEMLRDRGIKIERKTLYSDIKLLNQCGYEVNWFKKKHNYYYTEDRAFEISELKILVDAVFSANFITEKKTEQLLSKITRHAGKHRADKLKQDVFCHDTTKRINESVLYSIDTIITAKLADKKIAFTYFDYNLNKERVYRKNGTQYVQTPVQLIYTNDNYYLVTYSDKYNDFVNFRVDRMGEVNTTEMPATKLKRICEFDCIRYKREAFSMYSGQTEIVELVVHNSLIDVIIDRFGIGVKTISHDKEHFCIKERVDISPTFFAWCFEFGDKLWIKSPGHIREVARAHIQQLSKIYN